MKIGIVVVIGIVVLIVVTLFKDVLKEAFETIPYWAIFGSIFIIAITVGFLMAFGKL